MNLIVVKQDQKTKEWFYQTGKSLDGLTFCSRKITSFRKSFSKKEIIESAVKELEIFGGCMTINN